MKVCGAGEPEVISLPIMYIRITATPPGEAPLEVREQWVGLVLPVAAGYRGPGTFFTAGVLTGPRSILTTFRDWILGRLGRSVGYPVEAVAAVDILAKHHPTAADWWRNARPDLLRPGRKFMFHAHVCEPLTLPRDFAA